MLGVSISIKETKHKIHSDLLPIPCSVLFTFAFEENIFEIITYLIITDKQNTLFSIKKTTVQLPIRIHTISVYTYIL